MSYLLKLFYDISGATGQVITGRGVVVQSRPDIYDDGHGTRRPCLGFVIPSDTPNGWGCDVAFFAPNYYPTKGKGILWLNDGPTQFPWQNQTAGMSMDDFTSGAIAIPVTPPVDPPFDPNADPMAIIQAVYNTGKFNLATHDGCGKFTEECCKQLHDIHSVGWGHIKKNPGQEQYNGHAIDAVQLLNSMPNCDKGIYDIIVGSQAPGAHPALNRVSDPNPQLWYYPA